VGRVALCDATHRREYERELLRAKERAEHSELRARSLARTLQATLIPPSPPTLPGLDVSAAYRPAGDGEEVGGDFYDIFAISTGDWVVALGDVCGKGVDAAVVTALVRHTIRALCVQEDRPSAVLHALNEVLLRQGTERFCTVVVLRLRQSGNGWIVTLSAGGHPLPLLLASDGAMSTVGEPGSLVGVLDDPEYHDSTVALGGGDLLVTFTDGVTEGRRGNEFYGDDRLKRSLRAHRDQPLLAEAVLDEVLDFQQGSARDDIAVVAVRVPELGTSMLDPQREEPSS
jgi:sigma-B regulation protein RsbU (phosphoserine phosphatase)